MNKIERIKELTTYLNQLRDKYYNESQSLVSDFEYDRLYDELEALEKETGFVMANSPTVTVGYEVKNELEKVEHSHPMLSLDKTKSVDDLVKFIGNNECVMSLKMDGLTVLLTYENGDLIKAETRGNGYSGELITTNAKAFENIPLKINYKGRFEIEGEAIITYDDFEKINATVIGGKYKNPRNLASGSVRQLNNEITSKRHVKFVAWKVPNSGNDFDKSLYEAQQLGFCTVPRFMVDKSKNIENTIHTLKVIADKLKYPIDGLVLTYNDVKYGLSLGMTGHHPRHSLAYKFFEDREETEVIDVEFTMGKTGILTPTAIFKPVELCGTTVERASLHNLSVMKSLTNNSAWYKGMKVNVFKSNEIIPQISEVVEYNVDIPFLNEELALYIPLKCPICGHLTEVIKENDSEFLYCSNPDCKGKLLGKLTHSVSRDALNIDGLSEQTLEKFINLGWLTSIEDIYHLADHKERMIHLDGFGKKSVEKLLSNIEKSRETTLQRLLYSLSIPLIGKSASKAISKYCKGSYEIFTEHMALSRGKVFLEIDDFGEKMWEKLDEFWSKNCHLVTEMVKNELKVGEKFTQNESLISSDILAGKTFCVTGSVEHFKNRNELSKKIEELGGKVTGSVTSKTSFLINNDPQSSSSKNQNARKLNIPIISEQDFIHMIS